jgi:uncharacterized protein (TIGR00251 family)
MDGTDNLSIPDVAGGGAIAVKATAGASRDRIVGVLGDCLKVATAQPPEKGKANRAIAALLAKALGAACKDVALLAGASSPRKEFRIEGLTGREVRQRLAEREG